MPYIKLVLKRPMSAILLLLTVVVFGISAVFNIQLEYFPDLEMPMQVVYVVYPGADADSVERLVAEPVEDVADGLAGVKGVVSESHENYTTVQISYDYDTDMDDAYSDLKEQLDALDLPESCQTPAILEVGLSSDATLTVAAESVDGSDILSYVSDTVVPELETAQGVAQVEVSGSRDEYVRIVLDPAKMQQYSLTFSQVANALTGADFDMPLGSIANGSQELGASARTEVDWTNDLNDLPIQTGAGTVVRLNEVVTFCNLYREEADSVSRYNGQDSVLLDISKKGTASTMEMCSTVEELLDGMTTDSVQFEVIHSSADDIMDSLLEVLKTLVVGVGFTMLVLWLFFGDLRASLIVGSSMPFSLLAAMFLLNAKGLSFDLMAGTGMIIAIGMIVDNSIVILESCFRAKETHASHREAAIQGTAAMLFSVLGSTITTVVVYAPLTTTSGLSGQMNQPLCWSIIFTMVASLLSAITVVPLLFFLVKPQEKKELPINRVLAVLERGYQRVMPGILAHPWRAIGAVTVLFVASCVMATGLVLDLFPSSYDGSIKIEAVFRSGTKLEVMDARIQSIEQTLLEDTNFDSIQLSISESSASITAYSGPDCKRDSETAVEYYTDLFANETNIDLNITPSGVTTGLASLMSTGNTKEVTLVGEDLDSLELAAEQVSQAMTQVPGVLKLENPFARKETNIRFVINPLRAANAGLTPSSVASQIYLLMNGVTTATMEFEGDEYQVKLEYPEGLYDNEESILAQAISTGSGTQIALRDLVSLRYANSIQTITRTDGQFSVVLTATTTSAEKYEISDAVDAALAQLVLPEGTAVGQSTVDKQLNEEIGGMGTAIIAAVFLVFLVMAIQFESMKMSLMVMTCIPFSLIGSFGLMALTDTPLSMMALMGILMLIGMVVNNGILLVDGANELRKGLPLREALVQTGLTRLRPILMTTLTTVLSMLPMVLSTNSGMEMMRGMAYIIIGGLCTSTVLALFLMPPFYLVMEGKKGKRNEPEQPKALPEDVPEELPEEGQEDLQEEGALPASGGDRAQGAL